MTQPRWLQELSLSLASNPQMVLTGNVRDYHVVTVPEDVPQAHQPARPDRIGTADAVRFTLWERGIHTVFLFDPIDGLRLYSRPEDQEQMKILLNALEPKDRGNITKMAEQPHLVLPPRDVSLAALMAAVSRGCWTLPAALVLDYATWLVPDSGSQRGSDEATQNLEALRVAATLSSAAQAGQLYNPILWIVNQQNDLPNWLLTAPGVRVISIEMPGRETRRAFGEKALLQWPRYREGVPDASPEGGFDKPRACDLFADVTEGFTLQQGVDIIGLAKDRGLEPRDLASAQFAYRVGVIESEWEKPGLRAKVSGSHCVERLGRSVKGQPHAIERAADIVQRAVLGLSGAESSSTNPNRPKGVLFFAGPTGVGKTLLAKAITELVFSRSDSYARYDMSEYSQQHAEARLIGAPPGYVGYSAGGQLTEAVRHRPFSLLLFDEIEKADPLILDKFLQILDEGRLTDGSGMTVNFSETLIVFTSNVGITREERDAHGNRVVRHMITYEQRFGKEGNGVSFAEMEARVRRSVREYFEVQIQRPELLNRVGEGNIVVFDFIDPDSSAAIVDQALRNVKETVRRKHGVQLELSGEARNQLGEAARADRYLRMGGRGLNSAVEEIVVNPLARAMAEVIAPDGSLPGGRVTVLDLSRPDDVRWVAKIRVE